MRLAFMGTPEFALTCLKALIAAGHDIACVYSQPPRPAGRGKALRLSPVHEFAQSEGLAVRTPTSLKAENEHMQFAGLNAEAAVVVAYGLLLPRPILVAPRLGCFNIHASLLPRWRGAAPIQRAIMAGDAETGICIMRMEEGLDTGPVCARATLAIAASDTAGELHDRLAALGAKLMVETLSSPQLHFTPQSTEGLSYARKIDKAEAEIDWTRNAPELRNHIHGLSPFPGAWFQHAGTRIKVLRCAAVDESGPAGVALDDRLTIACGSGALRLLELQREGKGAMEAADFLRGFSLPSGTKVG